MIISFGKCALQKNFHASFGTKYTNNGLIQRRLAWPLCKNDKQICEVFHVGGKKRKWELLQTYPIGLRRKQRHMISNPLSTTE